MANNKHTSKDLKDLTNNALVEKVQEETKEYRKVKFNHSVTPLDNPNVLKEMRRNIARLNTELRARHIKAQQ